MRKKITLMFVAFLAMAAFAATQVLNLSRRASTIVTYEKITSLDQLTTGEYLIVCESKGVAFDGSLATLDVVGNTIEVTPTDGVIESSDEVDAAVFTIDVSTGYIKSNSGFYIGSSTGDPTSTSNGLKQSETPKDFWNNIFSFDDDGNAVIIVNTQMALRFNAGSTQLRFRYFKNYGGTQEKIQLYKKVESSAGKDETLVYDFEAAAAAEENPDNFNGNQNNGQGFFGWEKADKTDSRRNDYKGYTNYKGTNLPEECHVWRRSDRINGNVKDGGLYCPSDKEMAIDGLVPGATVTIIYDATNAAEGSKELIWAMGDGSTKTDGVEAGTRTSAIINGVEAVSGETPIPSGTKIKVNPIIPAVKGSGYIVVKVWKKMVIKKVIIEKPAPTVYDFKGAQEAGETPLVNLGYGSPFYVWEKVDKADSRRQDFKGYKDYSGENLPAECHVWRRSDRYDQAASWKENLPGLNCPNDREMVIDGLTAGSAVKIEYDATNAAEGSKEMIWATGTGAEPNTLAVVGNDNTTAVSGITTIPSGKVIHIVSTDKGYFGFKVKKNMVITKITIGVETPLQDVKKGYGVFINGGSVNGAVTVDKFVAAEGETVTIKASPEEGYSLVDVVIVDAEGNEVPVVDNKTFVMPASNVTIKSATFKKVKDVVLNLLEPCNISEALNEELGTDGVANNLTINLAFSTNYTITEPLVAAGSIKLIGENSVIDASALSDAFIKLYENPISSRVNNTDYYGIDNVLIQGVTLNNVRNSLFWDNNVKYCVKNFMIDNALIMLATEAVKGDAIISFEAGGAKDYAVKSSTVYNTTTVAIPFLRYPYDAYLRNYGYNGADDTWSFTYKNNTFYNVARDENGWVTFEAHYGVYDDASAQAAVFDVQNNIFYNSGSWANTGGMIMGERDKGAYKSVTFTHNTYIWTIENDNYWYWNSNDGYTGEVYIMRTKPHFADADKGDFTLGIGDKQQKFETGDPRWLTYYDPAFAEAEYVDLYLTDGAEISSAIANEIYKQGIDKLGPIYVGLSEGEYTIENTIEAPNSFVVYGPQNYSLTGRATIDATKLDGPFVLMSKEPTLEANEKGAYVGGYVEFIGADINNLKQQLVYANKTQYLLNDVAVVDCIIGIDGTAKKTIFDFNGGGNTKNLLVLSSTIWANPTNGQNGGFFSSQSSKDVRELDEEATQIFAIEGSTLYNITNGKTVNTLRKNSQDYQLYYVGGNIIVDCGKSNQFLKGLNAGQAGKDTNWIVDTNVFNFGGAISAEQQIGSSEENIKNTIEVLVNFADAANGDFRQGGVEMAGDYRWYDPSVPTAIEEVKTNVEKFGDGAWYTIQGVRVDKPAKGMYIHNGRKVVVK